MPIRVAGEKLLWNGGLLNRTIYLALHTGPYATAANEFQSSNSNGDGYAPNYARSAMALAAWTEDAVTGARSNTAAVQWADPGDGIEWPGAMALGVWSRATGGDLLVDEQIVGAPLIGTTAARVRLAAGQIVFDV